jgi:lysophospholipase L1-like esterase
MRIPLLLLASAAAFAQSQSPVPPPLAQLARLVNDYGNTERYASDNAKVPPPKPGERRVVFMGDSITDNWQRPQFGGFFPGKPYIDRGIGGQETSQMLLRFYPDVIALKPQAVVILAGTNDIGGNLGPTTLEAIENNLMAMSDLARANNIKVILASLTPVCDYHERTPQIARRPPEKIVALNRWIQDYCERNHFVYLDYYSATIDDKNLFRADITDDGLHPNAKGYQIMGPLAERAIEQALGQ